MPSDCLSVSPYRSRMASLAVSTGEHGNGAHGANQGTHAAIAYGCIGVAVIGAAIALALVLAIIVAIGYVAAHAA